MKTTLNRIGIVGFIFSIALIALAEMLQSAPLEVLGVVGFILSPVIKGLGDK